MGKVTRHFIFVRQEEKPVGSDRIKPRALALGRLMLKGKEASRT